MSALHLPGLALCVIAGIASTAAAIFGIVPRSLEVLRKWDLGAKRIAFDRERLAIVRDVLRTLSPSEQRVVIVGILNDISEEARLIEAAPGVEAAEPKPTFVSRKRRAA